MQIQVSECQNNVTIDGVQYEFMEKPPWSCEGCSLNPFAIEKGMCYRLPCTPDTRKDRKSGIFINK